MRYPRWADWLKQRPRWRYGLVVGVIFVLAGALGALTAPNRMERQTLAVIVSDADNDGKTILAVQAYLDRTGGAMRVGGAWAWLLNTAKTPEDVRDELKMQVLTGRGDKVIVFPIGHEWRGLLTPDEGAWIRRRRQQ